VRNTFWKLFEESVIVQSIITLVLVVTLCINSIIGVTVNEHVVSLTWIVVGFWFGQKLNFYKTNRRE
jgi:hypothetical protein